MPIAYKVLTQQRESYVVPNTQYSVHYPPRKRIMAPVDTLGLFVFDTLVHAQNFTIISSNPLIIQVEIPDDYTTPVDIPAVMLTADTSSTGWAWSFRTYYINYSAREPPPEGTLLTPWLRTLE